MTHAPDKPHALLPFVALLVGSSALALGPWLVRLADVGPVAAGFWRLGLGAGMLAALALVMGISLKPARRFLFGMIALAGFFFAADLAAWHVGIHLTKLGNATLFGNSGSFAFACYGLWVLRQRPTPAQLAALLLAGAGTILLLSNSLELSPSYFRGDLLALLAGLFYAGYLIAVDHVRKELEPIGLLFWASLLGAIFLWPAAVAAGEQVMPTDWRPVVLLAFSSQLVGQGLLVYSIGRLPPLVVGLGLLTQPAIAGAVGWYVYGEVFTLTDWIGAIAIGAALVLVRLRPRGRRAT